MTTSIATIQRTTKLAPRPSVLRTVGGMGATVLRKLEAWGVRYYEAGGRGRPL